MDVANPMRTVIPTVDADVLAVLDRTSTPLSGLRVAALARRGETRVRAVLNRLEEHGLVIAERHGNTVSYVLNRDHLLAGAVHLMAGAMGRLEEEIDNAVAGWEQRAVSVALFGSAARRDGDATSDIDILLVRPDAVDADDSGWAAQRHLLAERVRRMTGNRAQIVEVSATELCAAAAASQPLIRALRDDAVIVSDPDGVLARTLNRLPAARP